MLTLRLKGSFPLAIVPHPPCWQLRATRGAGHGDDASSALLGLLGHYGQQDADEAAKDHWSSGKLEPLGVTRLRPTLVPGSVHVLSQPLNVTVIYPPAAGVATDAVREAERVLDSATASALATGIALDLSPPRARRWRNVWKTMLTVREAPSIDSPMLDLVQRGQYVATSRNL